jgi:hypothetical protein
LPRIDLETLDKRPRLWIHVGVKALVWMPIAGQKARQAQHVSAPGPTDYHRPAGARLDQSDAAQDQGVHDPLAELRFCNQQRPQPLRRNEQGLHSPLSVGVHQSGPARQLSEFAHEGARLVGRDRHAAFRFVAPRDVDLAVQDERQAVTRVADLHERLTRAVGPQIAEPAEPRDLRRVQRREHLVSSGVEDRTRCHGHGSSTPLLKA